MRSVAVLAGIASLGACFQSRTVDCGDGFLCPADQACAAPGHCGDPVQVEKCVGKADWEPCSYSDSLAGSCRFGVCGACVQDREGCGSGWKVMASPTTAELNDVWVVGRADAYAVGNGGVLLHYDGVGWSAVATTPEIPTDLDLVSIWGSSGDDFYVISSDAGERNVLHVTNRTSLAFESMPSYGLKAVSGAARDHVLAVGLAGTIRRFDGTAWQELATGGAPFSKVHVATAERAFAIGPSGNYAHVAGTEVTAGTLHAGAVLTNVWVGETEVLVVGASRTLMRHDGAEWQPAMLDLTVPTGIDLHAVWGTAGHYYAVGDAGKIIHSTTGTEWSDASPGLGTSTLRAIDGTSATYLFVVGSAGTIWRYIEN